MSRVLLLAVVLALAGCGGREADRVDATETLLLDTQPRAVHAGAYLARARGYDQAEGVRLQIRKPGGSAGALELLRTGRVNLAVMRPSEQPAATGRGDDIVGVMAVVQRPLLALVVTRDTLTDHSAEVRAVIRTLQRGYVEAQVDPESAVSALVDAEEGLDRARVAADLDAIGPSLTAGARVYGALDAARLPRGRAFDTTLVGPVSRE
jgi:ABC-type nitrate/sulfonate/bicarbonate transport system substrate-binding protein